MPQSRWKHQGLVIALGITIAATIAACDSRPTDPAGRLTRVDGQASIDSTECPYGWIVIQGVVVCKDPE